MPRRLLVSCLLPLFSAPDAIAQMLPDLDLEWVCLRARLIVEARRVEPGVVEVLKVHHGDAKVGDRLALRRFEDLPQRAFTDAAAAWDEKHRKGAELDGCTAVLFLEPATEGGFEPVGWGSGVKWVVGDRVFGHAQPINPGDHVLVPDAEADSLDGLRGRLAGILGDPDPEVADLAHSCLEEIVGDDLGERPEPWLKWLAGLAAPAGK